MGHMKYSLRSILVMGLGIVGFGNAGGAMAVASKKPRAHCKQNTSASSSQKTLPSSLEKKLKGPLFVVQQHDAHTMHFDVRLEIGGVLVSWAVPKGPSNNPAVKRLALPTEDHSYSYAAFEGVIPEGEYGAGTVMVWDIGWYENSKRHNGRLVPMKVCRQRGHIEVMLHGTKLKGGYALIRVSSKPEERWLLIKMRDEYVKKGTRLPLKRAKSALTGRTLQQIAQGDDNDAA